nr:MAG TPA: hypothetical protein [Caudoviricetes sp.]
MSNLKATIQAAAEVTGTVSTGGGKVDQEFDSTSKNAQSGVAIAGELEKYVVKETGKGLSSNDYTDAEKQKNADNEASITALQSNKVDNAALTDYVKFTDYASYSKAGVAKVDPVGTRGISIDGDNFLTLVAASPGDIDGRTGKRAITPLTLNMSIKAALTDSKRITGMTETEKSNARDVIGAEQKTTIVPWESTLTEMSANFPGITKYVQICDHDITTLSLGVSSAVPVGYECSFTFQSGATATTITYPGELFKFVGVDCDADGDFVASANTNYEVSVRNLSTNPETPLLVARVGVY